MARLSMAPGHSSHHGASRRSPSTSLAEPKHVAREEISMRPNIEPEWLSVKDLMTLTGLGRTKCYELVASGELEAIKVGRAVRVSRTSLHRMDWPAAVRGCNGG